MIGNYTYVYSISTEICSSLQLEVLWQYSYLSAFGFNRVAIVAINIVINGKVTGLTGATTPKASITYQALVDTNSATINILHFKF